MQRMVFPRSPSYARTFGSADVRRKPPPPPPSPLPFPPRPPSQKPAGVPNHLVFPSVPVGGLRRYVRLFLDGVTWESSDLVPDRSRGFLRWPAGPLAKTVTADRQGMSTFSVWPTTCTPWEMSSGRAAMARCLLPSATALTWRSSSSPQGTTEPGWPRRSPGSGCPPADEVSFQPVCLFFPA